MANPKAPPGGFKQGGWYEGRQYWNGTFSNPGQINKLSDQQGAGQQVSKEVVRASSVAAGKAPGVFGDFLANQSAQQDQPKNKQEVTPYLDRYQKNLFQSGNGVETRKTIQEQLKPSIDNPAPLDRTGEFDKLRLEYGVSELETQLNDLKAQQDELNAGFREQRFTERGKTVPLNVIEGRISEEERQYSERNDYLGRQVARITDELNTKYNVISTYMNFKNLDYQDAVSRYESEFNQNLQIYNVLAGERKEARSAYESDRAAASANLQMFYNMVTSGNVDYNSIGDDQKVMISKLEAQAGIPIGFMASVRRDPGSDIVFTTSNEGITQVGIRNADGTISVDSYGTKINSGSSKDKKLNETEYKRESQSEMSKFLSSNANSYGHVGPKVYDYARRKWLEGSGQGSDSFDELFRIYRDPYRAGNDYGIKIEDEE